MHFYYTLSYSKTLKNPISKKTKMMIRLLIEGGEMKVSPTIAQKLGPLGLNIGKIIADVNTATAPFKGMKVPVALDVDIKTKKYKVDVSTPPTSELLKKELGVEKGTSASLKEKVGNAAIEQIIKVAKTKQDSMLINDFKKAVKIVVGSCVSLGILIENKNPKEIEGDIDLGEYDEIISEQKDSASPEKLRKLEEYFRVIKEEQDKVAKAEAAAAAETAAKTPEEEAKATPVKEEKKAPAKEEKKE